MSNPLQPYQQSPQQPPPPPGQPQPAPQQPVPSGKESWFKKRWLQISATAVVALLVGVAIGMSGGVEDSPEYKNLADDLEAAESSIAARDSDLERARAEVDSIAGDLPQREKAVEEREESAKKLEAELTRRELVVKGAETAMVKREKAVGIAEKEAAANTISSDGVYKVGSEVKAGTYRTSGQGGCYYAILRSTSTSDIVGNDNLDGQGFATVKDGQYFQTSRCADWVRQ